HKPLQIIFEPTAINPPHNGRLCSTWGNFHYKTYDGNIYNFPGLCNYVFTSHCKSSYEDFNIQIRRKVVDKVPTIESLLMIILYLSFVPSDQFCFIASVQPPYSYSGILIEEISGYKTVTSKLGVFLTWNQQDALLVELDEKYMNQTCGLCGDFNGITTYNEFISNGIILNPVQFGNLQKLDGPTEQCQDPLPSAPSNCSSEFNSVCETILTGEAFLGCNALVAMEDYADACVHDLCNCEKSETDACMCDTFAEYSRQCAHAGGQPLEWRSEGLCAKSCPFNMEHKECGSPCSDTCTNPERSQVCEDHCRDGCFCPAGTVYDDINNSGCIPLEDCHCTYNGDTYAPGASFASQCSSCQCTGGQWTCVSQSCPGICSIQGGSHITTFDGKQYSVFGDCSYVLTKVNVIKTLTLRAGSTMKKLLICITRRHSNCVLFHFETCGLCFLSTANITMFKPSTFFIVAKTNKVFRIEIQLVPLLILVLKIPDFVLGLCGNFNDAQADDFKAISGVVEGTSAAFANTWKTQAACPDIKNIFENPCALSIENEKYASHWCRLLTDSNGPFQKCHSVVDPAVYHKICMHDTCNCEKSEDCLCAALSSYVRACASKGVKLTGWRTSVCSKYMGSASDSTIPFTCQPTCRSLSTPDVTCNIQFTTVDGCTCEEGTFLDESGKCVPPTSCPCYYKGSPILSGEVFRENGMMCNFICFFFLAVCNAPMIYFDCQNATIGVTGAECQKSCQTLDMGCYSTQCVSGCMCPNELIYDGKGGCVAAEECPCTHNEATYNPGETIKVKCNTCTCKNRKWECSDELCLETCSVYGDGHYVTFDGKRYSFGGECEYTLVQNHCGKNSTGTFRVITENVPCGTTGNTCAKSINVYLEDYELKLADEKFQVIQRTPGSSEVPFKIRKLGNFYVADTTEGVVIVWNMKNSVSIKITPAYRGQVCGLCGNFDGNDANDFTTRSQSVVTDVVEFGNSWKVSPTCPGTPQTKDPCTANPYRMSWSQKQCSIINSQTFAPCHSQVEPTKYYDACVSDACACDTGGDCECFCTAVAAYAQACSEAGACISWRTPDICPIFCDYYNPKGECEWHYQPCGAACQKTCRNPEGKCIHELQGLEGCYPKCPKDKPYFDEDEMKCVPRDQCGCFDDKGNHYKPGEQIPSEKNSCYCLYDGKKHMPGDIIYKTTDGIGGCIIATCSHNGTIERDIFQCETTTTVATPTTVFVFTSTSQPTTTTGKSSNDSFFIKRYQSSNKDCEI
uniref:VWFD domain-containing protein n=1 Tax=Anolis carolinensis TaxID=28377 RepID=G1KJ50_ANOCA